MAKRPIASERYPYPYYPMANIWMGSHDLPKGQRRVGKYTGEYRTPRFGELFISGAEPECYECRTDIIETKYHIAVPVVVKRIEIVTYEEVEDA